MFNLLPIEDRKAMKSEYRRRVFVISLVFLFGALIASLCLLLPSVYIVFQNSSRLEGDLSDLKQTPESASYDVLAKDVKTTKNQLSLVKSNLDRLAVSVILGEILDRKPKGVAITAITWTGSDSGIQIRLEGSAASRDMLKSFADSLETSSTFSNVDVPVSSYAKAEDTDFSITLSIKKQS